MTKTAGQEPRELAQRLHRALVRAGLTQVEAANRAQVSRDFVHKAVQRGSVPRSSDVREAIAAALGVSPLWLWYGEGPQPKAQSIEDAAPLPATVPAAVAERTVSASAPPPAYPADAYVVMFETDGGEPFVPAGHGVLLSPSAPPRLGGLVWVRFPGYDNVAKYTGTMGKEVVFSLAGGQERRVPRADVESITPVLTIVQGVILR